MFKTDKEQQDMNAIRIVRSLAEQLTDVKDEASELSKLELSEFAEKAEQLINETMNSLLNKLIDLAKQNKFNALSTDIKNTVFTHTGSNPVY